MFAAIYAERRRLKPRLSFKGQRIKTPIRALTAAILGRWRVILAKERHANMRSLWWLASKAIGEDGINCCPLRGRVQVVVSALSEKGHESAVQVYAQIKR